MCVSEDAEKHGSANMAGEARRAGQASHKAVERAARGVASTGVGNRMAFHHVSESHDCPVRRCLCCVSAMWPVASFPTGRARHATCQRSSVWHESSKSLPKRRRTTRSLMLGPVSRGLSDLKTPDRSMLAGTLLCRTNNVLDEQSFVQGNQRRLDCREIRVTLVSAVRRVCMRHSASRAGRCALCVGIVVSGRPPAQQMARAPGDGARSGQHGGRAAGGWGCDVLDSRATRVVPASCVVRGRSLSVRTCPIGTG